MKCVVVVKFENRVAYSNYFYETEIEGDIEAGDYVVVQNEHKNYICLQVINSTQDISKYSDIKQYIIQKINLSAYHDFEINNMKSDINRIVNNLYKKGISVDIEYSHIF